MFRFRVHSLGGPDNLRLESIPEPPPLVAGCIRVAIRAAGVNREDAFTLAGSRQNLPTLPFVPGIDFCGIIDCVSEEVLSNSDLKIFCIGTHVFGTLNSGFGNNDQTPYFTNLNDFDKIQLHENRGAFSAYCLVNPLIDFIEVMPSRIEFDIGAGACSPYLTAYRALKLSKKSCPPASTVLICGGSSSIGLALINLLSQRGCIVIATAKTEAGVKICHEAGARLALISGDSDHAYSQDLMNFTHGRGVTCVYLASPGTCKIDTAVGFLQQGGKVVVLASDGQDETVPLGLISKEANIQGVKFQGASRAETMEAFAFIKAGLLHGSCRPIVQTFDFCDLKIAYKEVLNPSNGDSMGQIVVVFTHPQIK